MDQFVFCHPVYGGGRLTDTKQLFSLRSHILIILMRFFFSSFKLLGTFKPIRLLFFIFSRNIFIMSMCGGLVKDGEGSPTTSKQEGSRRFRRILHWEGEMSIFQVSTCILVWTWKIIEWIIRQPQDGTWPYLPVQERDQTF